MSSRHISSRRPKPDETLMSFLRAAQEEAGYSEGGFTALVSGSPVPDSRLAERRPYDWALLSRFFNASAGELYRSSERSDFYRSDDPSRSVLLHQRAPWAKSRGYAAHCPCCLKESGHWRRSWSRPGAIVCPQHGNVLVRHCCGCGGDLGTMTWKKPSPFCPNCLMHLTFSPRIRAPDALICRADIIREEASMLFELSPVDFGSQDLARMASVWRSARILSTDDQFIAMCATFCGGVELGSFDATESVEGKALRYAQSYIVAHFMARIDPTLPEHCWLAAGSPAEARMADEAVRLKLSEINDAVLLQETHTVAQGQLTMSFARAEGEWTMPSAA